MSKNQRDCFYVAEDFCLKIKKKFENCRECPYVMSRKNKKAMKELKKLGAMVTPLTVIDGEMVAGFNWQKLEQLLDD